MKGFDKIKDLYWTNDLFYLTGLFLQCVLPCSKLNVLCYHAYSGVLLIGAKRQYSCTL